MYELADTESYVVMALGSMAMLVLILACLMVSKLMGIEMIFIFQITYAGLMMITKQEALMVPLRHLRIVSASLDVISDASAANLPEGLANIYYIF